MQIYFYPLGNLDDFCLGTWTIFAWELGRISLGNLDDFCLGTWTIFAWELGRILLGNLDGFYLGTWTIIFHTTYWYTKKKRRNALRLYLFFTRDNLITQFFCHIQKC